MLASNPFSWRIIALTFFLVFVLVAFFYTQSPDISSITNAPSALWQSATGYGEPKPPSFHTSSGGEGISYQLDIPPTVGCEDKVNELQQRLIQEYTRLFEGIRYANIWGYLETENKGDAAIWSAQQILLSMLGIDTMEACRFMHKGCDMEKFRQRLKDHEPHSGIIMAGGGNFNDYYWEDQPSRMSMISNFTEYPVRAFPQSIYMTKPERIQKTKDAFTQHKNLQLAARDQPSYDWLDETFKKDEGIESVLVPDIAFMWGNRSDFRVNTKKTHDILILARKDMEISAGDSSDIEFGEGTLDLGSAGNVTYQKVDWKFTDTPGINPEKESAEGYKEEGKNQRAWAKAIAGFELLGSARFVITDRLHGHILSTVIGVPHVLMDSKLGKNLNFHNTWTRDCECTRITTSIADALDVAKLYFDSLDSDEVM